ncbi:MAG TPA: hypothetical protein VHU84_13205 [Lacipirellulaceae bacterium]|nr:hypothetical protein [Lacipirellulaceae bacterium]
MIWFVAFIFLMLAYLAWRTLRPTLATRSVERALQQFERNRKALEAEFFKAASSSGKPRGLAWKQCAFQPGVTLARDRSNGDIVGLVGVTISFEAVAGGGMEDVEAVGNLRAATAVFTFDGRAWSTLGRVIFNLEPQDALKQFKDSLDPI